MKTSRLLALAGFAALATVSASASADTLYQSLPDLTIAASTNAICSSCGGTYRVYDGFTLGAASVLNSVTFALQSNYNYPTDTTVSFNTRTGGTPGAELASYTFAPAQFASAVDTANNTTLVTVNLPSLALLAGDYSVSFYSPVNLGVPFYSQTGANNFFVQGFGTIANGVAAFSIDGSNAGAAVPEPATWAMMMLGFGGVGFAMRRKAKVSTRIRFA